MSKKKVCISPSESIFNIASDFRRQERGDGKPLFGTNLLSWMSFQTGNIKSKILSGWHPHDYSSANHRQTTPTQWVVSRLKQFLFLILYDSFYREYIYNVSVFISIVTIALFLFRRPRSIIVTCEWNGQRLWKLRLLSSRWNTDLSWNQEEGYVLPQQINLGRIGIDSAAQVQVKTLLTRLISYIYICIFFIPLLTIKQKWSFIGYFDRPLLQMLQNHQKPIVWNSPKIHLVKAKGTKQDAKHGGHRAQLSWKESEMASDRGRGAGQEPQSSLLPL